MWLHYKELLQRGYNMWPHYKESLQRGYNRRLLPSTPYHGQYFADINSSEQIVKLLIVTTRSEVVTVTMMTSSVYTLISVLWNMQRVTTHCNLAIAHIKILKYLSSFTND